MTMVQKERRRALIETQCGHCGVTFGARVERVRTGRENFCSKECSQLARTAAAEPFEARFWRQVAKSEGCWEWQGACHSTGYGQIWRTQDGIKKTLLSHRVAYVLEFGEVPDGLCVCHSCDNRRCVRPAHLFAATQKENMADMVAKGRGIKAENSTWRKRPELVQGVAHHSAKLDDEKIGIIRVRYSKGSVSCGQLGREFGVSATQIHRIVTGKTWKHLPVEPMPSPRAIVQKIPCAQRGSRVLPDLTFAERERLELRFWAKVQKGDGCWVWTAARSGRGYGKFSISQNGKTILRDAHRVVWELTHEPLTPGVLVCHSCDNPSCVNPTHLFIGTQADNMADMKRKQRGTNGDKSTARRFPDKLPRGANNSATKLSVLQVLEIRHLLSSGVSPIEIAHKYDVSEVTIFKISKRQTWKHIE